MSNGTSGAPELSRWKKLGLGLSAAALALVGVEVALLAFGVVPLSARPDPALGFAGGTALFERRGDTIRIAPRHEAFHPTTFESPKPEGTYRVFVFGGSTTWGWPAGAEMAFSTPLQRGLAALAGDRRIEVVNLGAGSYASWRVRQLAAEAARFEPDAFVVYMGNNEFLEKRFFRKVRERARVLPRVRSALHGSRLYSAVRDLVVRSRDRDDAGPDDPFRGAGDPLTLDIEKDTSGFGSDAERAGIVQFFDDNVAAIVAIGRQADAQVVLCAVPVNHLGTGPTRSDPISAPKAGDAASAALREGRGAEAERLYRQLTVSDGQSAMAWSGLGRALHALGRFDEARQALERSLGLDRYPQRPLSEFNAALRRHATETSGVHLCDLELALGDATQAGLVPAAAFIDTMHPTAATHERIARELAHTLVEAGVPPDTTWQPDAFDRAVAAGRSRTDGDAPETVELQAQKLLFEGKALLRQDDAETALTRFDAALALLPTYGPMHVSRGNALSRLRRHKEATAAYARGVELAPGDPYGRLNLGMNLTTRRRPGDAVPHLREATRLAPDLAPAHLELGRALIVSGEIVAAEAAARRAIALDSKLSLAYAIAGDASSQQGQVDQAIDLYERGAAATGDSRLQEQADALRRSRNPK